MSTASTTVIRATPRPLGRRLRESLGAYVYLAPATFFLLLFWVWPTLFALLISFSDYRIDGTITFRGLGNYAWVLQRADFYKALMNTVNFVLYTVPISLTISLFVAVLLNQRVRGLGVFRTVYFLPYITSAVAVSVVWLYVFNQHFGLANQVLSSVGLAEQNWLNESRGIFEMVIGWVIGNERFRIAPNMEPDNPLLYMLVRLVRGPSLALASIIMVSVWKSIGYSMVIFLAGLQGIDRAYYEAAEIDGATPGQKFRHITWPLVSPYTFFLAVITTIFAFKEFIFVYVMTPTGGIEFDTATIVFFLFNLAFEGAPEFGRAAAVGFILFLILAVISLIQKVLIGKRVHYD